jgi:uncharacterized membrane protein YqhA
MVGESFRMNLFRILAKLRYVSAIAVLSSFIGSALMFVIGGTKVYKGCAYFLTGVHPEGTPAHLTTSDLATIFIIGSLDAFLIGLALLYFGYGIYALVIDPEAPSRSNAPSWLVPKGIKDLKETLAQVIVIILFVLFVNQLWTHLYDMTWEIMIIPASIAFLALALKLMGLSAKE